MTSPQRGPEVHVLGVGALSAGGACAAIGAGSVWTALSRMFLHPEEAGTDEPQTHIARADYLSSDEDMRRLEELLASAVEQSLAPLAPRFRAAGIPCFLGLPAHRPPLPGDFEQRLQAAVVTMAAPAQLRLVVLRQGGATALIGLGRALELLRRGDADLALVAVVDSQISDDAMDPIVERGRLHSRERGWGLVPGEGAAAWLLGTDRFRRTTGMRPLCGISGIGVAGETGPSSPNDGRLAQAIRVASASLAPERRFAHIFLDLNGERARGDEWAFTSLRPGLRLESDPAMWTPATSWGDAGLASGGLLAACATSVLSAGWSDDPVLVWSLDEDGARAALVLSPSAPAERTTPAVPAERPAPHLDHDRALLREMLESAAALAQQRLWRLGALETAPLADWTSLAGLEARLSRHLAALEFGGQEAAAVIRQALPEADAATVEVASFTLTSLGHAAEAIALTVAAASTFEPAHFVALAEGLERGCSADDAAVIAETLARHDELLPATVAFAARTRTALSPATLALAGAAGPGLLRTALPRALLMAGQFQPQLLNQWLETGDDEARVAAAIAWLALEPRSFEPSFRHHARAPWALTPMVLAGFSEASSLTALEGARGDEPPFAQALGLAGEPAVVPVLLRLLERREAGPAAALALALITGAQPTEAAVDDQVALPETLFDHERARQTAGDTSVGVVRTEIVRLCRDPVRWRAIWEESARRLPSRGRLRMGLPQGPTADARALACPIFPPSWRRLIADSLAVRSGRQIVFRTEGWVARQQADLARLDPGGVRLR